MTPRKTNNGACKNDEAVCHLAGDRLGRDTYAKAFARLAVQSQTPMVVGLYGTWGVGKTSFMHFIEDGLENESVKCVWFDPWMHQFDDNPALALAQVLASSIQGKEAEERVKKSLLAVAAAFGSSWINRITGVSMAEVERFAEKYEEERFQTVEQASRLREHFGALVKEARGDKDLLVFFIDDLDRCLPDKAVKVLEALKLYFNIEGCIYFLAVDHMVLEKGIDKYYKDLEIAEADYLDKIVQLPFLIPPHDVDKMSGFVSELLPNNLQNCTELIAGCLSDNPRQIKRFVNTLILTDLLAKEMIGNDYDAKLMSFLLLLQFRLRGFYQQLVRNEGWLQEFKELETASELAREAYQKHLAGRKRLLEAFGKVDVPGAEGVRAYLYLVRKTSIEHKVSVSPEWRKKVEEHDRWARTPKERKGKRGNFNGGDYSDEDFSDANLECAYFKDTTLHHTIFNRTNLRGVNFTNADMKEVYAYGADLTNAILTKEQMDNMVFDNNTIMPNGKII